MQVFSTHFRSLRHLSEDLRSRLAVVFQRCDPFVLYRLRRRHPSSLKQLQQKFRIVQSIVATGKLCPRHNLVDQVLLVQLQLFSRQESAHQCQVSDLFIAQDATQSCAIKTKDEELSVEELAGAQESVASDSDSITGRRRLSWQTAEIDTISPAVPSCGVWLAAQKIDVKLANEEVSVVDGVGETEGIVVGDGDGGGAVLAESRADGIAQGEGEGFRRLDVDIIGEAEGELFSGFTGGESERADGDVIIALSGSEDGGLTGSVGVTLEVGIGRV